MIGTDDVHQLSPMGLLHLVACTQISSFGQEGRGRENSDRYTFSPT